MNKIRLYYWLTKPGIVYGNVVAAMAGFFLASSLIGQLDVGLLFTLLLGLIFVIGSACVFNNHIDRDIDAKMKRTKRRASATGKISGRAAIVYALILGVVGFSILQLYSSWRVVGLTVVAYAAYVILYGIAKRKTIHGTLVGTISGALPLVIGYVAVTDRIDVGAWLLFLIMVCWQMPHFYAIAMRRHYDYRAAKIPVLPVVKGMLTTKRHTLLYIATFIIFNGFLAAYGYVGYTYLIVMTSIGVVWLLVGIDGFRAKHDELWARRMFLSSLVVLLVLCLMLSVGGLLP